MAIGVLGILLALQGWKSEIPASDLSTTIDSGHELLESGKLPDRGTLTSFISFTPPGDTWLIAPGMLLFRDPRLFEFVGSVDLYLGTLFGIFLLSRAYLGMPCALLSVTLYGLSSLGLSVAGSLWQRYPIHCFFVWMVYWIVKWVEKDDSKFLALAILTWAAGMYVFMEIAPAAFILPVVWALFRPSVRIGPVIFAAILISIIWFPYLRFEKERAFVDIKSQVLRQRIILSNFQESWCNPNLARQSWPEDFNKATIQSGNDGSDTYSLKAKRWASKIAGRAQLIISSLLFANFRGNVGIAGVESGLFCVTIIGLLAWLFGYWGIAAPSKMTDPQPNWSKRFRYFGLGTIICGLMMNEILLARLVSPDGILSASSVSMIRMLQALLLIGGSSLIAIQRWLIAAFAWVSARWPRREKVPALLAICLVVPWSVMLLISESDRSERFWWMWPLQAMALAAAMTYLPIRLRAPKSIAWIGSLILALIVIGNPLLVEKLTAWARFGWAGQDSPVSQLVDQVATRIQARGKDQASIGYEIYIKKFQAAFNRTDPRYKVGANLDLLFRYRYSVSNSDRCAEGVSSDDDYRIVQSADGMTGSRINSSRGDKFRMTQQIGQFQVFERQ
jgi:hypothetical protein